MTKTTTAKGAVFVCKKWIEIYKIKTVWIAIKLAIIQSIFVIINFIYAMYCTHWVEYAHSILMLSFICYQPCMAERMSKQTRVYWVRVYVRVIIAVYINITSNIFCALFYLVMTKAKSLFWFKRLMIPGVSVY